MQETTGQLAYQCPMCHFTSTIKRLEMHIKMTLTEVYECSHGDCRFKSGYYAHASEHAECNLHDVYQRLVLINKKMECLSCNFSTVYLKKMRQHLEGPGLHCPKELCQFSLQYIGSIGSHQVVPMSFPIPRPGKYTSLIISCYHVCF